MFFSKLADQGMIQVIGNSRFAGDPHIRNLSPGAFLQFPDHNFQTGNLTVRVLFIRMQKFPNRFHIFAFGRQKCELHRLGTGYNAGFPHGRHQHKSRLKLGFIIHQPSGISLSINITVIRVSCHQIHLLLFHQRLNLFPSVCKFLLSDYRSHPSILLFHPCANAFSKFL